MAYSELYQMQNDIDWFFKDNLGRFYHVASAGGLIPKTISENDTFNDNFNRLVRSLPDRFDYEVNEILDQIVNFGQGLNRDFYLDDFISMAKKGFYSFDKNKLGDFENTNYHLVVKPIITSHQNEFFADIAFFNLNIAKKSIDRNELKPFNIFDLF